MDTLKDHYLKRKKSILNPERAMLISFGIAVISKEQQRWFKSQDSSRSLNSLRLGNFTCDNKISMKQSSICQNNIILIIQQG